MPRTEIPTNELLIGNNSLYRHSYGTESSSRGPQFVSRKLSNHAAHALRLSFEVAPWWTIREEAIDVPAVSAITIFYCTQIVSSWLCHVAMSRYLESACGGLSLHPSLPPLVDFEDVQLFDTIYDLVRSRRLEVERNETDGAGNDALHLPWN
jgi:hypothetical protein